MRHLIVALVCLLLPAAAIAVATAANAETPVVVVKSEAVLDTPHDLALSPDGKRLYVADQSNNIIRVLDPGTLETIGIIGKGELSHTKDVVFSPDGTLMYVADSGNDRIAIYRLAGNGGKLIGAIAENVPLPEGLAMGPDGRLYVTSARTGHLSVFELTGAGGKMVRRVGGNGAGKGEFAGPHDLIFLASGQLLVADSHNDRLQLLDKDLKAVRVIEGAPWNFRGVRYLAEDGMGRIYLADKHSNRVLIVGPDWKILHVITTLINPEGVDARGNRFWTSDSGSNRVVLYEWK